MLPDLPPDWNVALPGGLDLRQVGAGVIGAVLLFFGKRLYWLAVAAVGVVAGLWIYLRIESGFADPSVRPVVALVLALFGALGAVVLQKVAVSSVGLLGGLLGALWLTDQWRTELGPHVWWIVLLGGVLGAVFAQRLFELALIGATSLVGATLVSEAVPLAHPTATWVFVGLVVLGIVVQASGRRRRRRRRHAGDREG